MNTVARRRPFTAIITMALGMALLVVGSAAATTDPPQDEDDYADAIADTQAELEANRLREEQLAADLEYTNAAIIEAGRQLQSLEAQLPIAEAQLAVAEDALQSALQALREVEERLAAAAAEEQRITDQIEKDTARLESLRAIVAELARASLRGERTDSTLTLVLGSQSTEDFVDDFTAQHTMTRTQGNALAEMEQIAAMNRNRGARQEAVREYIDELKVMADEYVAAAEVARAEAEAKKKEIEDLLVTMAQLKVFLEAQREQYLQLQAQIEAEQEATRLELFALIRAAAGLGYETFTGTWDFPVERPVVVSSYGMRFHPIYHVWRMHAGTDFRASCGTPILSAADGQVEWTRFRSGYGNQVLVNHFKMDGTSYMSSYSHLQSFAVNKGDWVLRGQVIGYAGTTGASTGCHLHFEIYVNGNHTDPMGYLP